MYAAIALLALQTSTLQLQCVSKVGDDVYRAMDRTIVRTVKCHHDAQCEDATVFFDPTPMIQFHMGWSCRVAGVTLPEKD